MIQVNKIIGSVALVVISFISKENMLWVLILALIMMMVWCIFIYTMRNHPAETTEDSIDENGKPKKIHKKFR